MAEAVGVAAPRSATISAERVNQTEVSISRPLEISCLAVSTVVLLADLATDIALFTEYLMADNVYWAISTFLLILMPTIVIQIFSLRWHIAENSVLIWHWISHFALSGHFHRHISLLIAMLSQPMHKSAALWSSCLADLHLLNLLRSFLQSAPQVALQSYYCIEAPQQSIIRGISLAVSLLSVLWSGLVYTEREAVGRGVRWASIGFKSSWYCAMLAARLGAVILFSVVFGLWTLVPLGIHWAAMTLWTVSQKTEFCPTKLEELFYNFVIGFVYCFCYFNLREGRTRYRLVTFYTLMVTQNLASLLLFVLVSDVARQRKAWAILATVCIVAGTVIGLCSMVTYYRWFHPKGPITWKNLIDDDLELNNKDSVSLGIRPAVKFTLKASTNRSLKTTNTSCSSKDPRSSSHEVSQQPGIGKTDKKLLLDYWIARTGTPTFVSAPVENSVLEDSDIELYTVENTPQLTSVAIASDCLSGKIMVGRKKYGICSPTELNLKLSAIEHMESSIDDLTSSNLTLQKRRGICSSDELKDDLKLDGLDECRNGEKSHKSIDRGSEMSHDTDSSNKKTSSDSIDMDLELSFSDINSSDINEFNENIVQKLCLSTLKNIKVGNQDADIQNIQRIALDILKEMYVKKGKHRKVKGQNAITGSKRDLDTPTEVLSVHDYENICAVNIAREAWGLRSWNVYSDIENWQHDGSVVRDRRRDTLTSASSEISSCISQELRHHILSAIPPPRAPTYSNIFVDRPPLHDYSSDSRIRDDRNGSKDYTELSTFSAKPCLIDNTVNHLEPILEEIDDFGDVEQLSKPRLNSESSLVATIDEIRKGTITNSPRNVYHRRENMWDSPQMSSPPKIETSLKRALWKEPSKFNSSNILESLPEKENPVREFSDSKFSLQKTIPDVLQASGVDTELSKTASQNRAKNSRNQKMSNLRSQIKINNTKADEIHDLSNKDIDFLWQLVSDNVLPLQLNSTEDLTNSNLTSSLQSLIQKENVPEAVVSVASATQKLNIKKNVRNRPRRKFSLLREHFEPKIARGADSAMYCNFENKNSPPHSDPVFDVRLQNKLSHNALSPRGEHTVSDYRSETKLKEDFSEGLGRSSPRNIKEKRSLFLKQVLSPPKFNTKTKHKT